MASIVVAQLLEREVLLETLGGLLQDAIAGDGRVALVSGEAGIGKTSLVECFTTARKPGVRTLWGYCDALSTPRPLGPLLDIAAQVGGELAALVDSGSAGHALFAACLRELQHEPSTVVLEDVHWADEPTIDLLKFLGRRIHRTPALLLVTYRDDELGPQHPLRSVLGDLATSAAVRRLALAPLSLDAVGVLVGERALNPGVLHRQTGGNPFFVTEVLASGASGVPPTVRDAVLARAARLSPSARAVLDAAAVIGTRVEPWLLAEITAAEAQAAEQCLDVGVLVAQGELLAFRHELARQAVLGAIAPLRRAALHRMVLDALRASAVAGDDPTRLAHHAQAAGDHDAVLAFAPAAAHRASAASAHREAASLLGLALRHAAGLPPGEHAPLLEAYAWECYVTAQLPEAIAARRKAITLWRSVGDQLKEGENLAHLAGLLMGIGENAEAEQSSRAAIGLLEAQPAGRELALAYRTQAVQRMFDQDMEQAIALAEKAIPLAEQAGDLRILAMAYDTLGSSWTHLDFERGREYLERSLAIAHAAGLEARVATVHANLASSAGELHQFHRAARYLRDGLAYAAGRDLDDARLYMLAWQALTDVHLGRWDQAAQAVTAVLEDPAATLISRIMALVAAGRLRARRGDPGVAAALDEALELATRTSNLQRLAPVLAARAEAAWLAGDRTRTAEEARAVYDLAMGKRHPWFTGELAFWRWRAGEAVQLPSWTAEPYALQVAGDWRAAAAAWQRLSCPYEQARALADGGPTDQVAALSILEPLGARPAAEALRQALRTAGIPSIPRGPRPATRGNPFGLTTRQLDILGLLVEGLTNTEIAARLYLSPKTWAITCRRCSPSWTSTPARLPRRWQERTHSCAGHSATGQPREGVGPNWGGPPDDLQVRATYPAGTRHWPTAGPGSW